MVRLRKINDTWRIETWDGKRWKCLPTKYQDKKVAQLKAAELELEMVQGETRKYGVYSSGYVYIAESVHVVDNMIQPAHKIGITLDPQSRFRTHGDNPNPVNIIFSVKVQHCKNVERSLHLLYIDKKIPGNHTEWFYLNPEDIEDIKAKFA